MLVLLLDRAMEWTDPRGLVGLAALRRTTCVIAVIMKGRGGGSGEPAPRTASRRHQWHSTPPVPGASSSELRNRNAGGSFLVLPVPAAAADEMIE